MDKRTKIFLALIIAASFVFVLFVTVDTALLENIEEHKEYLYASKGVGISMLPSIKSGDILVILKKDSPGFLMEIGDILVYGTRCDTCPFATVCAHRLIRIKDDTYYVRGDNNGFTEEITYDNIVGKVINIVDNMIEKMIVNFSLGSDGHSSFTTLATSGEE